MRFSWPGRPPDAKHEASPILVTGGSGAGKSRMVARALAAEPLLARPADEREKPCVTMRILGPSTLKAVGLRLVAKLGYPMEPKATDHRIWAMVETRLKLLGTRLVHVDEFHHVLDNADESDKRELRNTLKSVVISDEHPVVLVLSGLRTVEDFFGADEQLDRRNWSTFLPRLGPESLVDLWAGLEAVAEDAGVALEDGLKEALLPRLVHCARGQMGTAMEMVVEATLHALAPIGADGLRRLRPTRATLTLADFAAHHRDKTQNADFANVFLVKDWHLLDPGARGILLPSQLRGPAAPAAPSGGKGTGR